MVFKNLHSNHLTLGTEKEKQALPVTTASLTRKMTSKA